LEIHSDQKHANAISRLYAANIIGSMNGSENDTAQAIENKRFPSALTFLISDDLTHVNTERLCCFQSSVSIYHDFDVSFLLPSSRTNCDQFFSRSIIHFSSIVLPCSFRAFATFALRIDPLYRKIALRRNHCGPFVDAFPMFVVNDGREYNLEISRDRSSRSSG
jgi:hypothetical protein